jgi:AmmeMemoRadiSam system protein B
MKQKLILFFLLILNSSFTVCSSQNIRPIRDEIGFCWKPQEMDLFIDYLNKNAKNNSADRSKGLVAGIAVHDDYLYAGKVYYPLFKNIRTKEVVIFGVTHGSVKKEMGNLSDLLLLDEFDKWRGPYGDVQISPLRELIKANLPKEDYIVSNRAHSIEHSIEAEIPFLQYYNRGIKITPIMVTQMPFEKMDGMSTRLAKIVLEYIRDNKLQIGKDIFFLISNDANHYGEDFNNSPYGMDAAAHKTATDNDRRIINENIAVEINKDGLKKLTGEIWPDSTGRKSVPVWCGRYPITFGLLTVSKILEENNLTGISGKLFNYSDTFTEKVLPVYNTSMGLTAVFSYRHWCGWFTAGFYSGN